MTKNGNSAKIPKRLPKIPKMRKTPTLFKKTNILRKMAKIRKLPKDMINSKIFRKSQNKNN